MKSNGFPRVLFPNSRRWQTALALAVASAFCSVVLADQIDATWAIPDKSRGGSGPYYWPYSEPTDWSPRVVPNNGNDGNTYRITIGQGLATLDMDPTVDFLTLNKDGQFTVADGHTFTAAATRNDVAPSALTLYSLVGLQVRGPGGGTSTANLGALSNFNPVTETLNGGVYVVTGLPSPDFDPPGFATVTFEGARIARNAAGIYLLGGGTITDEFGNDALEPLAINDGLLILGQSFQTAGDFTNNGTLILAPFGERNQRFVVTGELTNFDAATRTLKGGTYVFDPANNTQETLRLQFPGADIVTNSADLTLRRGDDLQPDIVDEKGQNGLRNLANNSAAGSLRFQSNFITNAGHFRNAGYIFTYKSLQLPAAGVFEQSSGELSVNLFLGGNGFGKLDTQGGSILLNGGRLTGGGRLIGSTQSNAIIAPGDGNYTPYMIFDGALTLGSSSILQFDLAATSRGPGSPSTSPGTFPRRLYGYDAIDCTGTIKLDGALKATLSTATASGARFTPASTDTFLLVKAQAPIVGSFQNVANGQRLGTTDGGGSFVVNYGPTTAFDPNAVVLSQFQPNTGPAIPLNISTRDKVAPGERAMIGGFIITGSEPKQVLVRAIGPSLRSPVLVPLADPIVALRNSAGATISSNDDWQQSEQRAAIEATGIAPSDPREPAIIATLGPGAYTAVVEGKNGDTGLCVVEVYDLDASAQSQLANISTRGYVDQGDNALIGGIIIGGGSGSTDILVRSLGPSLEKSGVTGATDNPAFSLRTANGTTVGSNDDWTTNRAAIEATGLAPTDDRESALRLTLQPGAYTAVVTPTAFDQNGVPGKSGIGLVEFYRLK